MEFRPAEFSSRIRRWTAAEIRPWFWGVLAGALALVLAVRGWDAHLRNAEVVGELGRVESDLERIRADQARLKSELRALQEDPVYVESVLRWMQSAEGIRK